MNTQKYSDIATAIRMLSVDAVQQANSGHPGMPMGMADIAAVLFTDFLKFDPESPLWPNRDRFVLSNGHGSMLLYSALHLAGYDVSMDDLKNFRQLHSATPGHPEYRETPGVETTTGPLGQGIANAVGMAMAAKRNAARFGTQIFNNKTFVTVGDGCLMEGISHEALELAGHLKLSDLIILFDDNSISIDGKTDISSSTNMKARMEAYGFNYLEADGHNYAEIHAALSTAVTTEDKPSFIAFKTHIGFGSPNKADSSGVHGSPLGDDEIKLVREKLNWPHAPFTIPQDIYTHFNETLERNRETYNDWVGTVEALDDNLQHQLVNDYNGDMNLDTALEALEDVKKQAATTPEKVATRKASGMCFDAMTPHLPQLMSGSADLTGSVLTRAKCMEKAVTAEDFDAQFIHYGVREHGMAAIMNGMALYGGIIPTSGTFLSFMDYLRPALRLSALMGLRVIHVLTHDSIGLGEDGPTHQPVEQLASSRAMPNVMTFRPCDLTETAECWQIALTAEDTPSVMSLTRQGLIPARTEYTEENLSAYGAYIIRGEDIQASDVQAIIMASGSEVELAIQAHDKLREAGILTRVASCPCLELFDMQELDYQEHVLPRSITNRVAVEAAAPHSWDKYLGFDGAFIGMQDFGASAPAEQLYAEFGITVDAIIDAVEDGFVN